MAKETLKNKIDSVNEEVWDELEGTGENDDTTVDDENPEDITTPFDPKLIKISIEPKTIDTLISRIKHSEIDMNPEFQRRGNLWPAITQSRLIESLLLKFPLPAFYFDATDDDRWVVVDGLQRLWTLKNFIIDQNLILQGLEILKDYNDKAYEDLSFNLKRRIMETQIITYLIQPGTPKVVKYNVFRRINTGGLVLNAQEIRHALNQDNAAGFLRGIAENPNFSQFFKVRSKRMEDCELILRGLTFIFRSYNEYEKPLATFLDKSMEIIDGMLEKQRVDLQDKFFVSLVRARNIFGKNVFSRSIVPGYRYRLNAALFEVWVNVLAGLTEKSYNKLLSNINIFIEDYKKLIVDKEFERAVVSSTSSKNSVTNRFVFIENLVNKYSH